MPRTKTAKFKCQKCGKSFAMAMHLGRHMTTMHKKAPRKSGPRKIAMTATNVGAATQLASLIDKLQAERQEHEDAIAQIDATFDQFGIAPATKKRRGRPRKRVGAKLGRPKKAKVAKKGKRIRRKFAMSGTDSVLAFVKKAGKKGVTSSEIVKHWKSEKRSGDGYTTLSQLVGAKKLKKAKIEGAKGSSYTAA